MYSEQDALTAHEGIQAVSEYPTPQYLSYVPNAEPMVLLN